MPHYQSPNGQIHFLDSADFEHLLPPGSVQITDEEAAALRPAPSPQAAIKTQIAAIEAGQGRAVREAALGNPSHLQAIEDAIEALRAQL